MSAPVGLVSSTRLKEIRWRRQRAEQEDGDLILRSGIRYRDLKPEEHARLIGDAQMGDLISQGTLLRAHAGLVEMWARWFWRRFHNRARGFDLGDLRQVARMGVLKAIEKYDPARAKLGTYASWWIFAKIKRFLEHHALPVRLPVHAWAQYRTWQQRKQALKTSIREAMEAIYEDIDDLQVAEAAKDVEQAELLRIVYRTMRRLHQAKKLSDRDIEILMRRYTEPGESLAQIGATQKPPISREWIRQLEEVALAKVRYAIQHPESLERTSTQTSSGLNPLPAAVRETRSRLMFGGHDRRDSDRSAARRAVEESRRRRAV